MLDLKWWGVAYGCDDVTYWSVFLSLGIDDPTGVQSELKRFPKGCRVCVTLSVFTGLVMVYCLLRQVHIKMHLLFSLGPFGYWLRVFELFVEGMLPLL